MVSDSGLERHRAQKILQKAGFDAPAAVGRRDAAAHLGRHEWDVVVWIAEGSTPSVRELLGAHSSLPPLLLVLGGDAPSTVVAAALDGGVADVVRGGSMGSDLVTRARAVARRTAAARVAAAETATFRELAEGGRDLLARHAPDGAIRFASGAAREILGCDPAALVGGRAREVFPPDALESDARPHVHRVRRRDGGWVWLETTARILRDPSGRVQEIHTNSRDVSWRMRADAERGALSRVATAVAEAGEFSAIADLIAKEAALLVGAESGALVRFQGDEGLVLGAAGPSLRVGDRVPLLASVAGGLVAPIWVEHEPWGMVLARGLTPTPTGEPDAQRLGRIAPLASLAVSNSRSRERLLALAATDPLTGLVNHGAFHRRLGEESARARRASSPLTLVMIDLDHFKRVNDTHGHQVGDEVLREVARRLLECARREDVPARVGGEEFAWLLPGSDLGQGMEAAERLRARIAGADFPVVGRLTGSLGVATLAGGSADDLARHADAALYRAKAGGRDAVVAWSGQVTGAPSG